MRSWVAERPLIRGGVLVIAASAIMFVFVFATAIARPATGPSRAIRPASPTTAAASPVGGAAPSPTPFPVVTPNIPPGEAQAEATATAFLLVYGGTPPAAGPAALRAALRPYDTDQLDADLAQGGAGGGSAAATRVSVTSLTSLGLAPDGRLVLVALVRTTTPSPSGPGDSPAEVYLAETAQGWRVDQVSL